MKMTCLLAGLLVFLALGCKREAAPVSPAPTESRMISDGDTTWVLGAVTMDGTNVALTNVSVRAMTNRNSK